MTCIFSYANFNNSITGKNAQRVQSSVLSSEQMALIEGGGCSFVDWFSAAVAWIECAVEFDPYACMLAAGITAGCIDWVSGGSISPTITSNVIVGAEAQDPCPTGYQRVGGTYTGGVWYGYKCAEL